MTAAAALVADKDLQPLNTFGLPARARWFAKADGLRTLRDVMLDPRVAGLPRLVLGGGSNLVLAGDFDGLVLQAAFRGCTRVREDEDAIYVRAGAGENWHEFVRWTLYQGYPGLENLSLIPGTVGAAPVQNIGAYGLELAERFHHARVIDLETGAGLTLDRDACRFGYRDSVFKHAPDGRYLIVAVTFRLPKRWHAVAGYPELARELAARGHAQPTPLQVSDAVISIRRRKLPDPALLGNAGSFFKNPIVDGDVLARLKADYPELPAYPQPDGRAKLAAGWLIERAGWKGGRLGPVGCYDRQALVLVNHGGARGADVLATMEAVRGAVRERFGLSLEAEPLIVGTPAAAQADPA